jgi:hypothetical protein
MQKKDAAAEYDGYISIRPYETVQDGDLSPRESNGVP